MMSLPHSSSSETCEEQSHLMEKFAVAVLSHTVVMWCNTCPVTPPVTWRLGCPHQKKEPQKKQLFSVFVSCLIRTRQLTLSSSGTLILVLIQVLVFDPKEFVFLPLAHQENQSEVADVPDTLAEKSEKKHLLTPPPPPNLLTTSPHPHRLPLLRPLQCFGLRRVLQRPQPAGLCPHTPPAPQEASTVPWQSALPGWGLWYVPQHLRTTFFFSSAGEPLFPNFSSFFQSPPLLFSKLRHLQDSSSSFFFWDLLVFETLACVGY